MKKIALAACALLAIGGVAEAQRARTARAAGVLVTPAEDPADSLFRIGRLAVNENEYRRAAALFKQLVDKYPESSKAGDALFWRAWALHKLGVDGRNKSDLADALVAIDRQQKDFPSSALETDGRVLRSQIRAAQAGLGDANAAGDVATQSKGVSQARGCGSKADEEMRLAAMDGLMSMNSVDAIPILKEVLQQRAECRVELRKRAVWLLSTKRGTDVAQTLLDVARNDPSSEVRADAVHWLSSAQPDIAVPLLDSIVFSGRDLEVRKSAVWSLSQVASRNERARQALRRAAEDEKVPEEIRSDAIFWLGNAKLVDLAYFRDLFKKTQDREIRDKILFAVNQTASPEATSWLLDLARDKTADMELRKNAIFYVSQRRAIDLAALSALYDQSRNETDLQEHLVWIFSQRNEAAALDKLIDIAKSDPNVERRKNALFWIGQKDDPRAKAFIRDILKG